MPIKGFWSNYMVHSNATGKFQSISFDSKFEKNHLVAFVNDLHIGDEVHRFRDAQGEFEGSIIEVEDTGRMIMRDKQGMNYTFHSVILAGVYDIKNLKLKLRPDAEKKYNSPWNIAADFNVDMTLHP